MKLGVSPNTTGGAVVDVNDVYIDALHGEFDGIGELGEPHDRQAILAAVALNGVTLPPELAAQGSLPNEAAVANAARNGRRLADLHLLAAMLDGARAPAARALRRGAKVISGATFLPEMALDAAHRLTARQQVAGPATKFVANAIVLPRVASEYLADRPEHHLTEVAHHVIQARYGVSYYAAHDLAPYVWATLLSDLRQRDVAPAILEQFGQKFAHSFEVSMRSGRRPEHTPPSLYAMYRAIGRVSIREAVTTFESGEAREAAARTERYRRALAPPSTTRPSDAFVEHAARWSRQYQALVELPYGFLHQQVATAAEGIDRDKLEAFDDMLELVSVLLERVQLPDDPQHAPFGRLLDWCQRQYGPLLADYVMLYTESLRTAQAPLGMVRMAESMARQKFWQQSISSSQRAALQQALTEAAFTWYGQDLTKYTANRDMQTALRAAYVAELTQLAASGVSPALARQRARLALSALPAERQRCHQLEQALPIAVERVIKRARQQLRNKR